MKLSKLLLAGFDWLKCCLDRLSEIVKADFRLLLIELAIMNDESIFGNQWLPWFNGPVTAKGRRVTEECTAFIPDSHVLWEPEIGRMIHDSHTGIAVLNRAAHVAPS